MKRMIKTSLQMMLLLSLCMTSVTDAAKKNAPEDVFRYPTPEITPPKHHPRVLLTPDFIPVLKQRIATDELCKKAWTQLCNTAAKIDKSVLPANNQFNKTILNVIIAQAMRYALDGDAFMGEHAIKQMLDNLERVEFAKKQDVTRDYGGTIYTASLVYDWCYSLLDADQKKTFIEQIKKLARRMEMGYPPYRQGALTGHGGEAQLMRDQLSAAIAVYDEDPTVYNHVAGRFFAEFVEARNFFYPSHRHHQGTSYGVYRFRWEIYSAWLFKRMAGVDVYHPSQGKVPYHWIYANCPNGSALIDGDTNSGGKPNAVSGKLLQVSNYYKDGYLQAESFRRDVSKYTRSNPIDFLLFYDPSVKPADLAELPTTKYFAEPLGGMIARTGWTMGRDSDVAVIEMKGAGYQFNNHQHLDAGAFQIYYRGHLAIDTGAYPKYGTPFDWNFNKRSISHNVMLAYDPDEKFEKGNNDGGQHFPNNAKEPNRLKTLKQKGYRSGSIISHDFGPNPVKPLYSYLRSDLTPAYGKKMKSYQRHFVTLNFDDPNQPAALLVYDRMQTTNPQTRKIWLLQTLAKPTSNQGQLVVNAAQKYDQGSMVCDTLLPITSRLETRCVGGPDGQNPVFAQKYPILNNRKGKLTPFNKGYRSELEVKSPKALEYFLNVMQIKDQSVKEILPVKHLQHDQMDGVAIKNWQVYFPRSQKMQDKAITFNVASKTKTHVLFTGIAQGDWYLVNKSKSQNLIACKVTKEQGTLYLELTADDYVLQQEKIAVATALLPDYRRSVPRKTAGKQLPRAIINGKIVPLLKLTFGDSNCLVDALPILKHQGAIVHVDSKKITAKLNGRTLECVNGQAVCHIDNQLMKLNTSVQWQGDVIMLPLDVLAGFLQLNAKSQVMGNVVYLEEYPAWRKNYPIYARVSSHHDNVSHPVVDAVDGDPETYFASQGSNVQLLLDLGKTMTVKAVDMIWFRSNVRHAFFSIDISKDSEKWKTVFSGKSSGETETDQPQRFAFDPTKARYVRITSNGNSQNNWNSICEAMVVIQ